ncbi:MAG: hypothetical protein ACRD8A_11235 [Candidatus Acidiferrales bacterium]
MDDVRKRVQAIYAEMVESVKSCFDDEELGHLHTVIRLTVEFCHYLEHGSVDLARRLQQGPGTEYFVDLEQASTDPFNRYDMEFVCESIRSGIDSFWALDASYRILEGATRSNVKWGMASSKDSFKEQFNSMFKGFIVEITFEKKCRILLDLFKLQIIFIGMSYG